jgi:hypothetical protein
MRIDARNPAIVHAEIIARRQLVCLRELELNELDTPTRN